MFTDFSNAPHGAKLRLEKISSPKLEQELFHTGITVGQTVYRLDAELDMHTVKIRHPNGETVLSGGMGGKILGHLGDGRIIALTEMKAGEKGHIETFEGGEDLITALHALGIREEQEFEMVRVLPPMEYITLINRKRRERLSEGLAAKILGTLENGEEIQFANSSAGIPFKVEKIIGGQSAQKLMQAYNIQKGDILVLEYVENAPTFRLGQGEHFILTNDSGLRIFLKKEQAESIVVSYCENRE